MISDFLFGVFVGAMVTTAVFLGASYGRRFAERTEHDQLRAARKQRQAMAKVTERPVWPTRPPR